MQLSTRISGRRLLAPLALTAAMFAAACGSDSVTTNPTIPDNPGGNPSLRRSAFILDVNTAQQSVKVSEPALNVVSASVSGRGSSPGLGVPSFSILAGDAVDLVVANYQASAVGAFVPGKVRVRFDVYIVNQLTGANLITPTFPPAPPGAIGPLLFPFEEVVTTTSGGTTVGGDGTEIIVELPNVGQVDASSDFDGAPYNFFNDAGCAAGSNDCFRYEAYGATLGAGATSLPRQIGFDIDPTVSNFRVRLIVAADLQNTTGPAVGGLQGLVTSTTRGALQGVNVTVNPGSFGGTTGATVGGINYTISNINTGPKTVTLSNLPAGCTDPGPGSVTIPSGGTATLNFTVSCTPLAGVVQGTVTSSLGGGINNVTVTVTPAGGSAQPTVTTNASGAYSRSGVPLGSPTGTGSVALSNLPSNCTAPAPAGYTGLTNGGTVTVDFTVSCTPPPSGYNVTSTWGTPSGGQVLLTFTINMNSFDDAAIPGADDISAMQGTITYNSTRLSAVSCTNVPGSPMDNMTANVATAGTISFIQAVTTPGSGTGSSLGLFQCTFNVNGSTPANVSVTLTPTIAAAENGTNLLSHLLYNMGVLP